MGIHQQPLRSLRSALADRTGRASRIAIIPAFVASIAGCTVNSAMQELSEARQAAADLLVQFTKAADASNRAVMADTDEMSIAFAREAEQETEAVRKDVEVLAPLLKSLRFSEEATLLDEFGARFGEYRALDRTILELAVENTNLKAQRLSFGAAQQAADALRDAVEALAPVEPPKDQWHVRALAATALAGAREIQALQAPHIAEADEATMTALEGRMAAAEAAARNALKGLAGLVPPTSRPQLAKAVAALDRLMGVNKQIIDLSRRNTNVRSLAMSLNEKGKLTTACDDRLRVLQAALAKRGFTGTR